MPIFYIPSDVIDVDVTTNLPRNSCMINAERLTTLTANLDCINLAFDTDSDDVDTCYGKFINKLLMCDKYIPLKLSTVKNKKIKRPLITNEI